MSKEKFSHGFDGLVEIVDRLLGPGGCPWDQAQTHETLKQYLLEEVYETFEAIDADDSKKLQEELGDLMLQPVMHAQMRAKAGDFDFQAVIEAVKQKLIRRHPHVFGDAVADNADDVLANWDAIKRKEAGELKTTLSGVPKMLPALQRAHQVSIRAARVGFDWPDIDGVRQKINEELDELMQAENASHERAAEELGDLLFAIVNYARWMKIDPEDALRKMVDRFISRFEEMERTAQKPLRDLSAQEWDELWNQAKLDKR